MKKYLFAMVSLACITSSIAFASSGLLCEGTFRHATESIVCDSSPALAAYKSMRTANEVLVTTTKPYGVDVTGRQNEWENAIFQNCGDANCFTEMFVKRTDDLRRANFKVKQFSKNQLSNSPNLPISTYREGKGGENPYYTNDEINRKFESEKLQIVKQPENIDGPAKTTNADEPKNGAAAEESRLILNSPPQNGSKALMSPAESLAAEPTAMDQKSSELIGSPEKTKISPDTTDKVDSGPVMANADGMDSKPKNRSFIPLVVSKISEFFESKFSNSDVGSATVAKPIAQSNWLEDAKLWVIKALPTTLMVIGTLFLLANYTTHFKIFSNYTDMKYWALFLVLVFFGVSGSTASATFFNSVGLAGCFVILAVHAFRSQPPVIALFGLLAKVSVLYGMLFAYFSIIILCALIFMFLFRNPTRLQTGVSAVAGSILLVRVMAKVCQGLCYTPINVRFGQYIRGEGVRA